ncbi:hypothetical protein BdWA1_003278 [Babesia duncani]|uniref:Thioredoxin domain-containing protein n=1 Tax=Babesia duncani TaxID=323732 RepID=A0AAD9PIU1_9APIC|nr:hypothetical protein BdWA1_003278 [Babesia duncani]
MYLAQFFRYWTSLPRACNISSCRTPVVLYIHANESDGLTDITALTRLAQSKQVLMYKEHYSKVPESIYDMYKVPTVPIILGIKEGACIAQVTLGNTEKSDELMQLLDLDPLLKDKVNSDSTADKGHSNISKLSLLDNRRVDSKRLKEQTSLVLEIYNQPSVKLHGLSSSQCKQLESIALENGYPTACNLHAKLIEDLAVKQAIHGDFKGAIKHCIKCYRLGHVPRLTESLMQYVSQKDALEFAAELRAIIGPDVHVYMTKRKVPGGVARKRRGFGGRYIWQGLDYRPGRYKPRNLHQYQNEWTCIQDKNLPINF